MARRALAQSASPFSDWPDGGGARRDLHALPVATVTSLETAVLVPQPTTGAQQHDHGGLRLLLDHAQFDFSGLGGTHGGSAPGRHAQIDQGAQPDQVVIQFPAAFDDHLVANTAAHAADALHRAQERFADRFFAEEPPAADTPVIDIDAGGARAPGGGKGRTKTVTDPVTDGGTAPAPTPAPAPTTSVAVNYTSGLDTPGGFNIGLVYSGTGWTDSLKLGFQQAAEFLSDIIRGDLASVSTSAGVIDDMRISVSLTTIDGAGGFAGWGGYTAARSGSNLPYDGYVNMDSADSASLVSKGIWDDFAVHEMLHALGFGTAWSAMGLVKDYGGDLRFIGTNATRTYNTEYPLIAGPDLLSDYGVPVETDGGSGTAGVHWDDATFKNEIMTGALNYSNVVSDMTVAALQDMGYQTTFFDSYVFG